MALAPQQSLQSVSQRFNALPNRQKVLLMVGLAAALAVLVGGLLWVRASEFRVLYSNVSDQDGGAIIAALQQANVPYRIAEGGAAILVPAEQVHEVRLRLASQGLPKGSVVGFELMEAQRLGISQFLEQVNYQRALEGELTRSIMSLSAVQSARVHLAIPKPSVFVREKVQPSASVLIELRPGTALGAEQLAGITHLIASSVPELSPRNVTIVDQRGNLLSQAADGMPQAGLDASQLKYLSQVEASFVGRIEGILLPVVGAGNVRAQVTAELDFAQVEQTAETFKPNTDPAETAIRSQQSSESVGSAAAGAAGVPGALSNQPPGAATAPLAAPGAGAAGAAAAPVPPSSRQSTVNYELDKTVKHVKQPVGTLKRLSAAVVVNHKRVVAEDGKESFVALTAQEIEQITNLVREAIGFSAQRGDTLNVVNLPFAGAEPVPEVPLWQRPKVVESGIEIGKYLLVTALFLAVVLGVVRPIVRELARPVEQPPPGPGMAPMAGEGGEAGMAAAASAAAAGGVPGAGVSADLTAAARELAKREPKVVANVVKEWLKSE